jgi:hypothetical protein
MLWVWFEPTIPVFEWAKTVHALNRATTVIGFKLMYFLFIKSYKIQSLCKDCFWEDTIYFQLFTLFDYELYLFIFIGNTERD